MNELSLSQSQTPLLYVKDDWIWQMALHDKQWTENHLKTVAQSQISEVSCGEQLVHWEKHYRLPTTLCCTWELGSSIMTVHHTYSREPLEQGTWWKQPAVIQGITSIHTLNNWVILLTIYLCKYRGDLHGRMGQNTKLEFVQTWWRPAGNIWPLSL